MQALCHTLHADLFFKISHTKHRPALLFSSHFRIKQKQIELQFKKILFLSIFKVVFTKDSNVFQVRSISCIECYSYLTLYILLSHLQTMSKPVIKVLIQSPPSWIAWKKYQLYRPRMSACELCLLRALVPIWGMCPSPSSYNSSC